MGFARVGNARTSESRFAGAVDDRGGCGCARGDERGRTVQEAAYQASVLAVAANDAVRGESEARNAIALAPNWYRGHLLRSQILQFMGHNEEAHREADLSATLGARRQ